MNNGNLAQLFSEEGYNSNGQMERSERKMSNLSLMVRRSLDTLNALSNTNDLNSIINDICTSNCAYIKNYVLSQKSLPEKNTEALALQAALLRMKEIATVCNMIDTDENDALILIQSKESEALEREGSQSYSIMPPDLQAVMDILIDKIKKTNASKGGSYRIEDIVSDVFGKESNYFTGTEKQDYIDGPEIYDMNPVTDKIMTGDFGGPDIRTPDYNPPQKDIMEFIGDSITIQDNGNGKETIVTLGGDIIDVLKDKAKDALTEVAEGAAGNIASNALNKAIKDNLPMIIGIGLILLLIILFVVYAAKSKGK